MTIPRTENPLFIECLKNNAICICSIEYFFKFDYAYAMLLPSMIIIRFELCGASLFGLYEFLDVVVVVLY